MLECSNSTVYRETSYFLFRTLYSKEIQDAFHSIRRGSCDRLAINVAANTQLIIQSESLRNFTNAHQNNRTRFIARGMRQWISRKRQIDG
jgi:hypothetical protein